MKHTFTLLALVFSLSVFSQSNLNTYLFGGSNNEYSYEHCFDAEGNFIVVGVVRGAGIYSTDTIGTIDNTNKNIYIRRYTADLTTLISSTIICGSGHDYCKSVDIDSQGNVFIGGFTLSSDVPVSTNAYQQTNNSVGDYEGYILKLNSDLDTILAATYFGGEEKDNILKLRVDEDDNVVVVGNTRSTTNISTINALDETYNGTTGSLFDFGDGFIAKFDNKLETKIASTYIGGAGDEACYSLVINNSNNIVITGGSTSADYPVATNAFQASNNGDFDMIITELSSDLTQVLHSTFVGANGMDIAWDIAYNETDNRYIIGAQTFSTSFNISGSVADNTYGGSGDGMIVILDGDMQTVHSASFVGGNGQDLVTSIYYNDNAIIYGGISESSDLPTSTDAYYPDLLDENSFADGFYGSIDNDLSTFNHLSYFGGNDDDQIWKVSSQDDKIYVNGVTYSTDVESDSTFKGASDGIIGVIENVYLTINDYEVENTISIYPNPASDFVNVSNREAIFSVEILNIQGQLVLSEKLLGTEKTGVVNIKNLNNGIYLVRVNNNENTYKIIVE